MKKRYIPENYKTREYKDANAVIYFNEINGAYLAMGFAGKRSKADFHYRFKNIESLENYVSAYLKNLILNERAKEERKQKRLTFKHTLQVDDILSCSWGYDQTNVDFYQVIEVIGKMVKIKEINSSMPNGEEGFMTGYLIPIKDSFKHEKALLKKVNEGNSVKISSYSWANKWGGKPCRTSWYA